ncbi:ATP-dependent endonuclease of the OLD family-like protein [Thermocrinis albus DSM 14484]|uniref:ATP-dependent endonuclease of the OLD family-like protein n=1 Tax=Thermocrinis albus (strain DSM 14484 / JCM 11386 / HI 11/12) TaxID=638303 RepID=D3SPN9_THEAH|nr:AAA family ATPase [Thermocrinis albus]ADC89126.1 ATP-dependent endonuclease of the OLD family-like protein [Thermocrinis albus DSM 14484]
MKIERVKCSNFRNLDGVEIRLHEDITFIVGENNIGKSNFLDLLDIIFNKRRFEEGDFKDPKNPTPIEIEISLLLDEKEIGIFEDYFDPNNSNRINVIVKQEDPDEGIKYFHKESSKPIDYKYFRCANFIRYDPLRKPDEELTFHKRRGVGKFLHYLIEKSFEEGKTSNIEIKIEQLDNILEEINSFFEKLKPFEKFGIRAEKEKDIKDLIQRLINLKDRDGIEIMKLGYGVQFQLIVILSVLERIMYLLERKQYTNECIYTDTDTHKDNRYISLILGLDEPEIHLHPYMQRSLIKYIKRILSNEDKEFLDLLKNAFNISGLLGQAIVVTHSPNILLNDYKQIVRFYVSSGDKIEAKSGISIQLGEKEEKQLLKNIPHIKEAFFSNCVIVVEGDTEAGAIPVWVNKLLGDMDEYGISVLKADGKGSIEPLCKLLNHFGIKTISIADKDDGKDLEGYDFITKGKDFEEDLVNLLFEKGKQEILYDILVELGAYQRSEQGRKAFLERINKEDSIKKLRGNKSIILGRIIGELTAKEDLIPEVYRKAILKVKEYVESQTGGSAGE